MRALARPRLLTQRSVAASHSKAANQRLRSLGRAGGKCPGQGLGAAQQLDVAGEG